MEISKMNYRDMLGFPKKKVKKVVTPIPRKPSITKKLKEEFGALNEWSEVDTGPKRWFKPMDQGLTEFEKEGGVDNVKEHMAGGLTYKKGKTVMVTHKTSGKELVIIDNPKVRKEYEKIGYFAEGKITEKKESAIDVAKRIVKDRQHEKGVDMQTANLIMKIYHVYDKHERFN